MSESDTSCKKMSDNVKRSLFDKIILLETAKNLLNQELNHFTRKTAEEIEVFLNSPCTSHTQDGVNLLKTLDSKLYVIQKLLAVFKSLKSDPQTVNLHLIHTISRSPQHRFLINHLTSNQTGVFVPQVRKFGLLLQTGIQTSSITRAMQIFGATLTFNYLTSSIQSEQEPPCKLSFDYSTETKVMKDKEFNVSENVKNIASETEINLEKPFPLNQTYPDFVQNVASPTFTRQFGNDPEVQYQKQTSSQLVCFLKMNRKMEASEVSLSGAVEKPSVLVQQVESRSAPVQDQKSISGHSTSKKHLISGMNVSGPVFKVKNGTDRSLTYSCMIATHSELWDIGNVSTDTLNCQQDKRMDFTDLSGVLESFNPSCCSSSDSFSSEQTENMCGPMDCSVDGQKVVVRVPEFQIKKFEEMPVVVTHVVSPSQFYIQHKDANLQGLSDIMANKNMKSYAERNCIPDIGCYVMGLFSEPEWWCRAQVMKICGMNNGGHGKCRGDSGIMNIEVEIRRIDYGDTARLSLWNVKELCEEAAEVPAQALQVSLAEVNPVNGESWSDEAIGWFKDKVKNRTLYARLYPQTNIMMVGLFMEKGKIGAMRRGASLSVRLAQNGHARHDQMKNLQLKRSSAQERSRKQSLEWEKYLISCYSHHRK